MSRPTLFGRYQAPEPPSHLERLHFPDEKVTLKLVDHEPHVAVLDQEDLHAQGIKCSTFIPGAGNPDALGSCTAQATTAALSNLLPEAEFLKITAASSYQDTKAAEEFAIGFYHACTDQTGDPSQEWPPTDCGSSGPYIYAEAKRLGYCTSEQITHAAGLPSLLQSNGVLQGSPWLNDWMEPDASGFIDGDGKLSTLEAQIRNGVAGGHETYQCAIEKLVVLVTGAVDPSKTVLRVRNSWTKSWGDNGDYRVHLSTLVALSSACDFRQLV